MVVGAPRETLDHEHRVGLTPFGAGRLFQAGAVVLVEHDAGREARFQDVDYERAGARIVYDSEEIYRRCDLVCCVGALHPTEIELLKSDSAVCGFHHLAVSPRASVDRLLELRTTLVGYEIIRDAAGDLQVLAPMSTLAGHQAVHVAAHLLQNESGGRGIILGAQPAIPPATVLVLGAGAVGTAAALHAVASGAHVIVLDSNLNKLEALDRESSGRVVTVLSGTGRLEQYTSIADVIIGAVLVPGYRAPFVVTEEMVRGMKPGSVIVDVSIDQGGCVETSRPTSAAHPTYVVHDVVHYCVPNMTANVARTASRALANGALPYLEALVREGVDGALQADPGLVAGIYMYRGKLVNSPTAASFGLEATPLTDVMGEGR